MLSHSIRDRQTYQNSHAIADGEMPEVGGKSQQYPTFIFTFILTFIPQTHAGPGPEDKPRCLCVFLETWQSLLDGLQRLSPVLRCTHGVLERHFSS